MCIKIFQYHTFNEYRSSEQKVRVIKQLSKKDIVGNFQNCCFYLKSIICTFDEVIPFVIKIRFKLYFQAFDYFSYFIGSMYHYQFGWIYQLKVAQPKKNQKLNIGVIYNNHFIFLQFFGLLIIKVWSMVLKMSKWWFRNEIIL